MTMQEIMAKLIARERSACSAAAVSCLRAQIVEALVTVAPMSDSGKSSVSRCAIGTGSRVPTATLVPTRVAWWHTGRGRFITVGHD